MSRQNSARMSLPYNTLHQGGFFEGNLEPIQDFKDTGINFKVILRISKWWKVPPSTGSGLEFELAGLLEHGSIPTGIKNIYIEQWPQEVYRQKSVETVGVAHPPLPHLFCDSWLPKNMLHIHIQIYHIISIWCVFLCQVCTSIMFLFVDYLISLFMVKGTQWFPPPAKSRWLSRLRAPVAWYPRPLP